ncbi:MAG: hypothetical protein FWE85_02920, partial [Clostridiales bacterium]|nr:hypothetical protein [Clostridiales bacterium]
EVLKNIINNKAELIVNIKNTLLEVLSDTDGNAAEISRVKNEIHRNENRTSKLIELFLDGGIDRAHYDLQNDGLMKQMNTLQNELQIYTKANEEGPTVTEKSENINSIVESILGFTEFSEELGKSLLHKVIVKDRGHLTFYISGDDGSSGEGSDFFIPLLNMP